MVVWPDKQDLKDGLFSLLFLFSFALAGSTASATTFVQSENQIAENTNGSSKVFRGQIQAQSEFEQSGILYTRYQVQVLERYKGAHKTQDVELVNIPGQAMGHQNGMRIAGVPELEVSKEYIFFVNDSHLVDWTSFQISKDFNGNRYVVRQSEGAQLRRSASSGALIRGASNIQVDSLDHVVSEILSAQADE